MTRKTGDTITTAKGRELLALLGTLRAEMVDSHRGAELHDAIAICELEAEARAEQAGTVEALRAAIDDLLVVATHHATACENRSGKHDCDLPDNIVKVRALMAVESVRGIPQHELTEYERSEMDRVPDYVGQDVVCHPGEVVGEWLQQHHYSQGWLAAKCEISASYISDVVQGKRGIGPKLALRLQRVTGMSPGLLVRMQVDYDLEQEWQRQMASPVAEEPK
jgi:addiction module HigA family antidote